MVATAGIIIIGDEILSGRTKDSNINWIASQLDGLGIRLKEARIKQLDRAEKQASVTGQLAAVEIDKGFVPGGTTAAILRNEGIAYDKVIPDKI